MAQANESFGLKVTTAVCIAITVILLVSVYFLNDNYNKEFAKREEAEKKASSANQTAQAALAQVTSLATQIGYPQITDDEPLKAAIKKDIDKLKTEIQAINGQITAAVAAVQKAGEANPKLDELKNAGQPLVNSFLSDPNFSYVSQLNRLKDILSNQAQTTTALSLNYLDLRNRVEKMDAVNRAASAEIEKERDLYKGKSEQEIKDHEAQRQDLIAKVDQYQKELADRQTQIANLQNQLQTTTDRYTKMVEELRLVNRDLQDDRSKSENILGMPGGRVTYVDYGRGEVRLNINRSQGAREMMRMTIFDRNAPGIPSDKPKATVELIRVGNPGSTESDSLARIVKTVDPTDPIRAGDLVYSPAWSPNRPQRFVLLGKLDINRDGKDDRADVIRLIENAGGAVEYDLAPPAVDREPGRKAVAKFFGKLGQPVPQNPGRGIGKISGLAYAYVTDDREPLNRDYIPSTTETKEDQEYVQELSKATREARDNGIRPLPLSRLLDYLGYHQADQLQGRLDRVNREAQKQLLKPSGSTLGGNAPPPDVPLDNGGAAPAPAPGDEPK